MPKLFAMDGCRAGWLVVSLDSDTDPTPNAKIVPSLEALDTLLGPDDLVAIDMPIGLLRADRESHSRRPCDVEARKLLGKRACTVFYAPARGVLEHLTSHPEASSWHECHTGKGLSCQVFHILKKIQILDTWLRKDMTRTQRVHEVHPEVSFAFWTAGGAAPTPIQAGKKTSAGRAERRRLIEAQWPGAVAATSAALGSKSTSRWQDDDLLDALAALWTLVRISKGQATCLPQTPVEDPHGLSLRIWA